MNPDISYDYAKGDLLESRNTYFYSRFQGREFLLAWREQRDSALVGTAEISSEAGERSKRPTDALLATIGEELSKRGSSAHTMQLLNLLVQRFEVTKRLHGEYGETWRPKDPQDYRNMERYVRFAEVLHLAYSLTVSLPYLNALLKCMDTLTALHVRLDRAQKERVQALVDHERQHIEQLSRTLAKTTNAT